MTGVNAPSLLDVPCYRLPRRCKYPYTIYDAYRTPPDQGLLSGLRVLAADSKDHMGHVQNLEGRHSLLASPG